jgi:hypothetical protein
MTALAPVFTAGAVIVVGLGASLAVFPAQAVTFPTRLASVFGLGCAVLIMIGVALVLVGAFRPAPIAAVAVPVAAVFYVIGIRRSSFRDHLRALRQEFAGDPVLLWLGVGVLTFVAVSWIAAPVQPMRGAWRYWSDGLELVDGGGIPSFTAQWGAALPVAVSKLGGNAFLGELSFVFRDSPFVGMGVALWISVVGYATAFFALGRELGLRWTAHVLPLLAVASSSLPGGVVLNAGDASSKLGFYEHENLGRMLAAVAAAIILSKGKGEEHAVGRMLAGGVVLSAAALTHLVPALVFAAFIGGVMVARIATEPRRGRAARVVLGAFVIATLFSLAPLAAARGDVGFEGTASSERYTLFEGRYDPTAAVLGAKIPPRPKSEARWYRSPSTTTGLAAEAAVGRDLDRTAVATLFLLALLAASVVIAWGSNELRSLVAGAAGMAAALLGLALLFSYRYSLYIQATFGERRLFEYASIPLILLILAVVELGAAGLARRWMIASRAVALALMLGVILAIGGHIGLLGRDLSRMDPFLTAAGTTPCDSRLLVGRERTRGSFQALTGRISITEGLEPFLRPAIVNDVLEVRAATRRFLQEPNRFSNILTEREIDFVIARESPALNEARDLSLIRDVDGIGIYAVLHRDATKSLPRPSEAPGYHCFRRVPG